MATNQQMLDHLSERNSEAIVARADAAAKLAGLREFVALKPELSTAARDARIASLKHSGCSLCLGWSGEGSL
jgi:hypothetical protein